MPTLLATPPRTQVVPVTEVIHNVSITDPYRWLEDQNSQATRDWIRDQTAYARAHLDSIPGRDQIRQRIRELLDVETVQHVISANGNYYFCKRLSNQEQPSIYMRQGLDGTDQILVDPTELGGTNYTAVKPAFVSPDGQLLLYEIKEGGERAGRFEILNVKTRKRLPDCLPRGFLRGFAFAPDSQSFYYSHETQDGSQPFYRAVRQHKLGTATEQDVEVFSVGELKHTRLILLSSARHGLFIIVHRVLSRTITDFYLLPFDSSSSATPILTGIDYMFGARVIDGRVFAVTERDSPNLGIVELRFDSSGKPEMIDVVPPGTARIQNWVVLSGHILVAYIRESRYHVYIFDLTGKKLGEIPVNEDETVRLIAGAGNGYEVLFESESFVEPTTLFRYSLNTKKRTVWCNRCLPFDATEYTHCRVHYSSKDGTIIPMFLVGRRDALERKNNPTILTSYGGFGTSMTPQFSVFVAFLMEHGCIFALPNIRGGSEFGASWHHAARRLKRQTAFDDFLASARWLITNEIAKQDRLAIFGGSNSGLLVGAALTQAPELFRAVVCIAPLLDMLRYHLFNSAQGWIEEYGTADDRDDFAALAGYSPYHRVLKGVHYPAVMMISGDSDQNCNPLHARKMSARLQDANGSENPIILDYSEFRGHSPVLPLSMRVEALTDRMAFLCEHLGLPV